MCLYFFCLLDFFAVKKIVRFRVAVYAWNPLVIVDSPAAAHNDVLALLGIVGGLALLKSKRPRAGKFVDRAGAMAKVFPAVLLPVWIRRAGWPRERSGWWAAGLVAASGGWCCCRIGARSAHFRANLAYYEATWKNYHASLYSAIDWLDGAELEFPRWPVPWRFGDSRLWLAWKRAEPAARRIC